MIVSLTPIYKALLYWIYIIKPQDSASADTQYKLERVVRKRTGLVAILDFITAKFVMGYPCVSYYILFYIHGTTILHFLFNITK